MWPEVPVRERINVKIDHRYHDPDLNFVRRSNKLYAPVSRYHRHQVFGLDNIPKKGRCIIAVNHSFATYDNALLSRKVFMETGRVVRSLADVSLFYVPSVGRTISKAGAVPGRPKIAEFLLEDREQLVLVAPGGMREALRPSSEKYKIIWDSRKGFVRLAIKTQSPIVLSCCPGADDLYTVYENTLTKLVYRKFKLPATAIRGLGLTLVPRPVRLSHYLSELQMPPVVDVNDDEAFEAAVDTWHAQLADTMQKMLEQHR